METPKIQRAKTVFSPEENANTVSDGLIRILRGDLSRALTEMQKAQESLAIALEEKESLAKQLEALTLQRGATLQGV